MEKLVGILNGIYFTVKDQVNSILVKTDDENLDILLENPDDQFKFQQAIEDVLKNKSHSADFELKNGNKVKISL